MTVSRYVLNTGEEAAHRLRVVNSVHGADTEAFLRRAGLAPGLRVADVGCGVGTLSAWLAKQVGPRGEVHAVDISPDQVAQAEAEARRQGAANARFTAAPAQAT